MNQIKTNICFFMLALSLASCSFKLSLPETRLLASEFFNGKLPPEVTISEHMRGQADDKYRVATNAFKFNDRNVRVFHAVNKAGKIGNLFVEGANLNTTDTSNAVALTRDETLRLLIACKEDAACALAVLAKMESDCKEHKDAANCFYCKKHGDPQGDDCPWLNP